SRRDDLVVVTTYGRSDTTVSPRRAATRGSRRIGSAVFEFNSSAQVISVADTLRPKTAASGACLNVGKAAGPGRLLSDRASACRRAKPHGRENSKTPSSKAERIRAAGALLLSNSLSLSTRRRMYTPPALSPEVLAFYRTYSSSIVTD